MDASNLDDKNPLADDLLIGGKAIAGWLGVEVRQVFYMKETGQLPFFNLGGKLAARKSKIKEHITQLEALKAPNMPVFGAKTPR
jgi:hypothetical protein